MEIKRLWHTLRLAMTLESKNRADYLRKHQLFYHIGKDCSFMDRKVPLYARLISLGDNVHIASNVSFLTHDITHVMLNNINLESRKYQERIGCIDIGNNVFIGSKCIILNNVKVGSNCVIGAGSIVTKDIPDNSVAVGIPAKRICTFQEYLAHREKTSEYPLEFRPQKQQIGKELERWCWSNFVNQRNYKEN